MEKRLILSFTHTNYCVRAAGTEKFVRNLSNELHKQGYSHLNFFSFYDGDISLERKKIGVNLNDHFIGIYNYTQLMNIVDSIIMKNKFVLKTIHFQHLLHHNLTLLTQLVNRCKVPVVLFVHDFFLICKQTNLINSQGQFCGTSIPCDSKCGKCLHYNPNDIHLQRMIAFLDSIYPFLSRIIAPSEYVTNAMKEMIPKYSDYIITRPHLIMHGIRTYQPIKEKIRIAFAGGQINSKGFDKWKKLVSKLNSDIYEFYYFGTGKEKVENVTNIYVSTAQQGENAMFEALKKFHISLAFVWPLCAETYSYVYYEMAINGVFVISNDKSGNIFFEIIKNKNGLIFNEFKECISWLNNKKDVIKEVNEYRINGTFHPEKYSVNNNLKYIIVNSNEYQVDESRKVSKCKITTYLYFLKYHKDLR